MNNQFKPKSGQTYWVIKAKFDESLMWWIGNTNDNRNLQEWAKISKLLWTEDVLLAKCFETENDAMEENFDLQLNGVVTEMLYMDSK